MSDVIRLQPAKAPRRSAYDGRGAQILFFTGVRYERMNEDKRAAAPQAPCVAQRQREGSGGDRTRRR
jgi:hypothetical protein